MMSFGFEQAWADQKIRDLQAEASLEYAVSRAKRGSKAGKGSSGSWKDRLSVWFTNYRYRRQGKRFAAGGEAN